MDLKNNPIQDVICILCSVIHRIALEFTELPLVSNLSDCMFLESITATAITTLLNPLLKLPRGKQPSLKLQDADTRFSTAVDELFLQIEIVQTGGPHKECKVFFKRMASTARLLLVLTESGQIQCAMIEFSMQGLLLLSRNALLHAKSFQISEEDLTLFVSYTLWLWDHGRYEIGHGGVQWGVLRRLVSTLTRLVTNWISDLHEVPANNTETHTGPSHHSSELNRWLDLLLDTLRDDLIATMDSTTLWKAVAEFHTLLKFIINFGALALSITHTSHIILIKTLLQRWSSQNLQLDWLTCQRQIQSERSSSAISNNEGWEAVSRMEEEIFDDREWDIIEDDSELHKANRNVVHARWFERTVGAAIDILSIMKLWYPLSSNTGPEVENGWTWVRHIASMAAELLYTDPEDFAAVTGRENDVDWRVETVALLKEQEREETVL
ncbi:hypothetical protein BGZ65_011751 [Modicella reniformis]|uniref:Uncharacterized protein n=1 Tax=Modicella reniformis TaxID=1440133 RepID=A0A9P6MJY9_9FUNG|nr:hypothetical protein BGZ65_011751 [Modicella reniformis]